MKYPAGTRLKLISHPPYPYKMSAAIGAIAVTTEPYDGGPFVRVSWVTQSRGQMDGGYFFSNFEVIDPRIVLDEKIAALQAERAALDVITTGDTVKTAKNNTATVIAVNDDKAWVKTKRGQNLIANIKDLTK